MSSYLFTALALAMALCSAEYIEWTSAAVTARPHVKAVIPLNRLSLKTWAIDSLTLNVAMAGSQSEIGLNPVLVADLIHSSWCGRISNGSMIRYLPLNEFVPSPAATWSLNCDGKTILSTKHVTNWVNDICIVIRPIGHDISSKVSASAWTKTMNLEMGVALDSALHNMLTVMALTCATFLAITFTAILSLKSSFGTKLSQCLEHSSEAKANSGSICDDALSVSSDNRADASDNDDELDDEDEEYKESDDESNESFDDTENSNPETNGNDCHDGFVDIKDHRINDETRIHQRHCQQ